jgi:nitrate/TMAO reductase-like tetraheme cytochrome c subunit
MRASDDANSTTYPLNLPETCGMCHGDPELTARLGLDNVYELYVDSIHGSALEESGLVVAANCSSCHGTHGIRLPSDPSSTVYPLHVPETCGTCHVRILEQYRESVHGVSVSAGELAAAICTDCHTSHTITPTDAPEWQLDVVEECGTCHEASIETFRDTFHGQVSGLGFTRAARCSDCHGAHGIRPIEDPESLVADANRVETCRQCHPDANSNFAEYSPHADHGDRENYPTLFYAARLMNGLIIGVFAFFGIHTLLWFNRTSLDRFRERWRNRKSASSTTDEGSAGEGAE